MRKLLMLIVPFMFILTGCLERNLDDMEDRLMSDRLDKLEKRVKDLEDLCVELNANISSMHSLVMALNSRDFITGVLPLEKGDREIGYSVLFAKHSPVIIYHASSGNGYVPSIGVKKASDGYYYWTMGGEWLLVDGRRQIAQGIDGDSMLDGEDGVVPQLKVEDGFWLISYDEGATWARLAKAGGSEGTGNSLVDVADDDNSITFVFSDGTNLAVPRLQPLDLVFDGANPLKASPNSSLIVSFTVSGGADDISVEILTSGDVRAKVFMMGSSDGELLVKTGDVVDEYTKIVLVVSDGMRTISRTLLLEAI